MIQSPSPALSAVSVPVPVVNLTAFFRGWWGGYSDALVLGESSGDESIDEGAEEDLLLLCGKNLDMWNFIAANARGCVEFPDGATEVTVVVEPDDALENGGGLTAGLLELDVNVSATPGLTPPFFIDERTGGGGSAMGVGRCPVCEKWPLALSWERPYGEAACGRRCGVRDMWSPIAICSTVGRDECGSGSRKCCKGTGPDSASVERMPDFCQPGDSQHTHTPLRGIAPLTGGGVGYRFLVLGTEEEDPESVRLTEWMRREAAFGRGG